MVGIVVALTQEKDKYQNKKSLLTNYKNLLVFVKNKILFYVIMLEFLWHFGYSAVESNIDIRMYEAGFSKESFL